MKKYKAMPKSRFTDRDARVIGKFLEQHFPSGAFKPQDVVDLARSKSSPLHHYFEWDDTKAAELYRRQQARELIRCVWVVVDEKPIRETISVNLTGDRAYMRLDDVLKSEELTEQVIDQALSEATAWRLRYENYARLKPIAKAIKTEELKWQRKQQKRSPKKRPVAKKKSKKKSKSRRSS